MENIWIVTQKALVSMLLYYLFEKFWAMYSLLLILSGNFYKMEEYLSILLMCFEDQISWNVCTV